MTLEQAGYFSYLSAGVVYAALGLWLLILAHRSVVHWSLPLGAAVSSLWLLLNAFYYPAFAHQPQWLLVAEAARYGFLITAPLVCLQFNVGLLPPKQWVVGLRSFWLLVLAAYMLMALTGWGTAYGITLLVWGGLLLSLAGLVASEQLYRQQINPLLKVIALIVALSLIADIYIYATALVRESLSLQQWLARGIINGGLALAGLLGCIAYGRTLSSRAQITVSRPVAFYTTSMILAGALLAIISIANYYVKLYGGSWHGVAQTLLLFFATAVVSIIWLSASVRTTIVVWLDKHFFRGRYDYRVEWLRIIRTLSDRRDGIDFQEQALAAVTEMFKSRGGALWLMRDDNYVPVTSLRLKLPEVDTSEPADSEFINTLQFQEWVFSPTSPEDLSLGTYNRLLPAWVQHIDNVWLVMPLLTERRLVGFIVLAEPERAQMLTWEDLDLLKAVGRQVASYLERHEASESLAEAKQFDTLNKLTAFVVHDLNNLRQQQELMVKNAQKHRNNPEFFDDAMRTIEGSVKRMKTLLDKLKQAGPGETKKAVVKDILEQAVADCSQHQPKPVLEVGDGVNDLYLMTDKEQFIMVCVHLIRNAQQASDINGKVVVSLSADTNHMIIKIVDQGEGMDAKFIRDRLFKPFDSTKIGKGMGIGVYQAREFVRGHNGSFKVKSTLGKGTTITITLPKVNP